MQKPKEIYSWRKKTNTHSGFTIVELLVVIVVIAILAGISFMTYRGIQEKAYVAKVATAVDAYVKIFEMYKADHGVYPIDITDAACLGLASHYPAADGFGAGVCEQWSAGGPPDLSASDYLITELQPYITEMPNASLPVIEDPVGGVRSRGAVYGYWDYTQADNDVVLRPALSYYPKGNQDCPKGEKGGYYDDVDVTYCYVWLGNPENPDDYYGEPYGY